MFKNKRVLMEAVHKQKAEKIREKTINDQLEARRTKNKATRERKAGKREERLAAVSFGKGMKRGKRGKGGGECQPSLVRTSAWLGRTWGLI